MSTPPPPTVCGGCGAKKRTWPTFGQAVRVVDHRIRRGAKPLRVYPCPAGAGWHITHRRKGEGTDAAHTR